MPRVYGPKKTKDKKKNPTAGAQVAEAAQVQLPAQHSGLQLWFGFNPESRNFDMLQVWPLEKKRRVRGYWPASWEGHSGQKKPDTGRPVEENRKFSLTREKGAHELL